MKKLIIGLLLIGSITNLSAQSTKKITTYYDYSNTKIKERYYVETTNMQKHGEYKGWSKLGRLAVVCNYYKGQLHGKFTDYTLSGLFCGESGEPALIENYQHGKKHGVQKYFDCWREDKGLKKTEKYNNGEIVERTTYYSNGKKKEYYPVNGIYQLWYESGKKNGEVPVKDYKSNGVSTKWHENGVKSSQGNMINGVKDGKWTEWDENGAVVSEENYINGKSEKEIAKRKAQEEAWIAAEKKEAERKKKAIEYEKEKAAKKERFRIEREKQQALLNDYKRTNKVLLEKYEKVESLYVVVDELGSAVLGETVYKVKKKKLYNAYHIYYDETAKLTIGLEDDYKFRTQIADFLIEVCDRVIELFDMKTKSIEKQLKNQTDIDQIGKILWQEQ